MWCCGATASINDDEDVDEGFNNLFEELSEELQIDGDIAADEYSNFHHEVCLSFSPINSDQVDWNPWLPASRNMVQLTTLQIEVESKNDRNEKNENESGVSQISP